MRRNSCDEILRSPYYEDSGFLSTFFFKYNLYSDAITPHPNHVNIVNSTLTMIEGALKSISDEMFEAQRVLPGRAELPDDDNRELMGVMRVGALAANTVLAGECEFMMVMMMKEKPTYQMLARIAKGLRKVFSIFVTIFAVKGPRQLRVLRSGSLHHVKIRAIKVD